MDTVEVELDVVPNICNDCTGHVLETMLAHSDLDCFGGSMSAKADEGDDG